MAADRYERQVQLLVNVLPFAGAERCFALKGGTAINLFYRDLPRLSVDIDLTYLPIKERAESLADIDAALNRIARAIEAELPGVRTSRIAGGGGADTRILVRQGATEVKIETSPVTRGVVNEPTPRRVTETVEDRFGFAEISVLSFEVACCRFHGHLV
ncbi:nucleotidyl transferase AbiEii/AbiGii toxin family protein [Methylobacterium oryzihabitans]|uniref:Nucleotidyl transferase AbiEii/AbiGii toxin family protein n=1 Tax=Methylobacterium oryzihabitans TaxID=2499852 RepID=A0A3S2VB18_9HYPH|nr:nucleotidyl transferase AbiEii/AbiGii toxin family protein [Methylobacterium oryzihabitans]RVU18483.1 nucleotidyl transferase AbiEii/AbiGii toxin family protein [Methylobacterium oryzihabitans]